MIFSTKFTCLLDTNIIYPIEIRDLVFWFAHYNLFTIKWSRDIFEEWETVMKRNNIDPFEITKRTERAIQAFPDAMVKDYEGLIDSLKLSDEKDKHILAAAIKSGAQIIVTNNVKDFPAEYLSTFGLSVKTADEFLADVIDLNPEIAVEAFRELVQNRRNPDMDEFQVLNAIRRNGLKETANYLHSQL